MSAAQSPPSDELPGELPLDCRACGACCFGLDVVLSPGDIERFEADRELERLTVLHRFSTGLTWRLMKKTGPHERCVALSGRLGDCRCSIYEQRPELCRELAAGAPDCLSSRRRMLGL